MRIKNVAGYQMGGDRYVGSHQVVIHPKFGPYVKAWPRKRGPKGTAAQQQVKAEFAQAVKWAKSPLACEVEVAQAVTPSTGYLLRDLIESAIYGRVMVAYLKDGRVLYGARIVSQDAQALLDTISTDLGSMLVRGPDGWYGLDAGPAGYVLTSNGPNALPNYAPGGSGPGGNSEVINGFWGGSTITLSTAAEASKGQIFIPNEDFSITSLMAQLTPAIGGKYHCVLATLDGSSNSPTVTAVITTTPITWSGTTLQQWLRFELASPVNVSAGTYYAIMCCRSDSTGTAACPIWQTSDTTHGAFGPLATWHFANIAAIDINIGDVLGPGTGAFGPYNVGFVGYLS